MPTRRRLCFLRVAEVRKGTKNKKKREKRALRGIDDCVLILASPVQVMKGVFFLVLLFPKHSTNEKLFNEKINCQDVLRMLERH